VSPYNTIAQSVQESIYAIARFQQSFTAGPTQIQIYLLGPLGESGN